MFLLADITNIDIVGGQQPGVHEFLPTILAHQGVSGHLQYGTCSCLQSERDHDQSAHLCNEINVHILGEWYMNLKTKVQRYDKLEF